MVGVKLPARNKGISGTLPTILAAGATYSLAGCWHGLIQLGHPSTLHRPADGQFQLLNSAEEDQVVTEVIRAASVGCILWGSPTRWTQVAGQEKLRTSIPTVFQLNIVVDLLNTVRIRKDNKDGVLHTTKLVVHL